MLDYDIQCYKTYEFKIYTSLPTSSKAVSNFICGASLDYIK
jgi:hypothetical protein